MAGDKGYSSARIRRWLKAHGIEAIIPIKGDQADLRRRYPLPFNKDAYRRRSIIEQCVGWLKEARRIGTRFEKLAINYLAMLKLAMIDRYLRFEFSDTA